MLCEINHLILLIRDQAESLHYLIKEFYCLIFLLPPTRGLALTLGPPLPSPISSDSALTWLRRRFCAVLGLVFALAALLFVPCWLCCGIIGGAAIFD